METGDAMRWTVVDSPGQRRLDSANWPLAGMEWFAPASRWQRALAALAAALWLGLAEAGELPQMGARLLPGGSLELSLNAGTNALVQLVASRDLREWTPRGPILRVSEAPGRAWVATDGETGEFFGTQAVPSPGEGDPPPLNLEGATTGSVREVSPVGITLWYNEPSAEYYRGARERTYYAWATRTGEMQVAAYDHTEAAFTDRVSLWQWAQPDDHAAPSLHVMRAGAKAGLPVLAYCHHNSPLYVRAAQELEEVARWQEPRQVYDGSASYPRLVETADGRLHLFFRGPPAGDNSGRMALFLTSSADAAASWSEPRVVVDAPPGGVVYAGPVRAWGNQLLVAWSVYDAANKRHQDVYFVRSVDAGGTWLDGSGRNLGTSAGALDAAPVYVSPPGTQARVWDVSAGLEGEGHILFAEYVSEFQGATNQGATFAVRAAQQGDGSWESHRIGPMALAYYPGGAVFGFGRPDVVFLSEPSASGRAEICELRGYEQGRLWIRSRVVTQNSAYDQIRPQAVGYASAAMPLTWLECREYKFYTDFDTSLRTLLLP